MKTTTLTYPSRDGASTVRALLWEPDGGSSLRGIVQIVHGMSEHIERYRPFAERLCDAGYAVCANDHIGHGATASCEADLGHMPLGPGEDILISDVHALRELVSGRFADDVGAAVPYVVFGHSMGSFITRVYLTRHAFGVRAAVLCGTGNQPRALSGAGRVLTRALGRSRGERYVSPLVDGLGVGAYSKAIEGARTESDWICTDSDVVDAYREDPLCGQAFTVGAYHTLSTLVSHATDARLAERIPKSLPLLFIAGDADPVGECGAGVLRAVEQYRSAGMERVDEVLYEGMRHEILNEPGRADVYADVIAWLEDVM